MNTTEPYTCVYLLAPESLREMASALLLGIGYEAFVETDEGLEAYIPAQQFDAEALEVCMDMLPGASYRQETLVPRNWNAEWEAGYEAIRIGNFCQILASHHDEVPGITHTLWVDPQMSFGTGHHETTRLMIRQMEQIDFKGKQVLDMGCGTGILGILAMQLGADSVTGIDIDPWSVENARQNAARNGVELSLILGDAGAIPAQSFDLILANINRHILLADVSAYVAHLRAGGILLISGILEQDEALIRAAFAEFYLRPVRRYEENRWLSECFIYSV